MRVMTFAWFTVVGAATVGGVQACSGDPVIVENSASSSGSGGFGGGGTTAAATSSSSTAAATTASVTVAASSSSGIAGTLCGPSSCDDASLAGFVTLPACCPQDAIDKCGLDLTSVSAFIGVSLGCVQLSHPGPVDASCPDQAISAMGQMLTLPGCCRPDMLCGNVVDLSFVAPGVNFGCVSGSTFLDGGATGPCGGGAGSSSASSSSATSSGTSGSSSTGP